MKNKLFLLEDEDNIIDKELEDTSSMLNVTTMISSLIKGEWDAIDQYNSMIVAFESVGENQYIDTLREIVSEEYIHVGQLEKLVQNANPQADNIEAGHNHDDSELDSTERV